MSDKKRTLIGAIEVIVPKVKPPAKPAEEMTLEELRAEVERLKRELGVVGGIGGCPR